MRTEFPADCGNAPRIGIVAEVVAAWARGDAAGVAEWLSEDSVWHRVGGETHRGVEAGSSAGPGIEAERLHVASVVTHGRLASCDGYVEGADTRIDFSHVFRFSSTSKKAPIAEARSYCLASPRA